MTEPIDAAPGPQATLTTKDVNTLAAAERMLAALELRKAGYAYEVIAERLHYAGKSGAYNAVRQGLKRTLQEPADAVRRMELERLDKMQAGLWDAATDGDTKAVASVLTIMDRRAKLLGLDAPVRVDIQARVREWAAAAGLDPDEVLREAQAVLAERGRS